MTPRTFRLRAPGLAVLAAVTLLAAPAHAVDTLRTVGTVVRIDPAAVLADAADGTVVLNVAGRVYDLRVRETPWRLSAAETTIGADGSTTTVSRPKHGLVGTVAGDPASRVLLTVTPSGVDGHVDTAGMSLRLTPRRFTDHAAAVSEVVAREVPAGPALPWQQDAGISSIGNPAVLEWGDFAFYTRYGSANWSSKMGALLNQVNNNYWNAFGWYFNQLPNVYACNSSACDTSWGTTSNDADPLLYAWAVKMKSRYDAGTDVFDMAFLYSGKDWLGSVNGTSMLPGRYSAGQFADEGWYQGQTSTYEGAQLMSHEVGHTFSGLHDNYSYREPRTVCDLLIPILNICLQSHTENTGPQHWTIMCGSCEHQPSDQIWDATFTTWNKNQIDPCHDGTWSSGTYTPSSSYSMNMGVDCIP